MAEALSPMKAMVYLGLAKKTLGDLEKPSIMR